MFSEFISLLQKNTNVDIVVHKDPDGDALGSGLALKFILQQLGINSTIYCHTDVSKTYRFLPGFSSIITQKLPENSNNGHANSIITVDTGATSQIGQELIVEANIDHHIGNTGYAKINIVNPLAAATGEIIYDLAKALKVEITAEIATCLYVAISTDTGHFKFSNTTQQTFQITAEMVQAGANPSLIAHYIYETLTFDSVVKTGEALQKIQCSKDGKIVWSCIDEIKDLGPRSIIDYLREIERCEIAVTFTQKTENITKVSLRSKTEFDVRLFAEKFAGGGHAKAAGVTLNENIVVAEELIINQLTKDFTSFSNS